MSVLWTWATARDSSWLISKLFRDNVEFRLVDPLEMKSIFNKYTCVISLYFYELNLQAGWPTQKYFLLGKMPFFEIDISGEFASGDAQKCKNAKMSLVCGWQRVWKPWSTELHKSPAVIYRVFIPRIKIWFATKSKPFIKYLESLELVVTRRFNWLPFQIILIWCW